MPRQPKRLPRPSAAGLDDLDRALVDRLRQDGREGNRSLATALGVNEVTVAHRLRRMEDNAIMRVIAVVDMHAFERRDFALAFIRVAGKPVLDVAAKVAELPDTIGVMVTTGRYDMIVPLLARDHDHLAEIFGGPLAAIRGIDEVHGELALRVLKFESMWAALDGTSTAIDAEDLKPNGNVDELDIEIIRELQVDARQSNRRIAATLGVVEGTVRGRIKRLQDDRIIKIQAISDVTAFGVGAVAYVGLRVDANRVDAVATQLADLDQVAALIRTFGAFDLVAIVHAPDRLSLVDVILSRINTTKGVRRSETLEGCSMPKHSYAWARIL